MHNSADIFKSINKLQNIITSPTIQVITCGVLCFLWIERRIFGKNLSLLIAYKILVEANWQIKNTEANPVFSVEAYQSTKLVLQEISNAVVALGGV